MMKFFPVEMKHSEIIRSWFEKDYIQEYYYGQGLQNTLHNLDLQTKGIHHNGNYAFEHWIAYMDDVPFGFLMTTPVEGPYDPNNNYNKWFVEGHKTITLDLLIGEEAFLGKGLAHQMIKQFLQDKYSHVSTVLIDPSASNAKAIHVYEKAGFRKLEQFTPKFDPTVVHWMMRLDMKTLL